MFPGSAYQLPRESMVHCGFSSTQAPAEVENSPPYLPAPFSAPYLSTDQATAANIGTQLNLRMECRDILDELKTITYDETYKRITPLHKGLAALLSQTAVTAITLAHLKRKREAVTKRQPHSTALKRKKNKLSMKAHARAFLSHRYKQKQDQ